MYIIWALNGGKVLEWPPMVLCSLVSEDIGVQLKCLKKQVEFDQARWVPPIAVPAVMLFSIVVGAAITYWFEKPMQRYLRQPLGRRPTTPSYVDEELKCPAAEESRGLLSEPS